MMYIVVCRHSPATRHHRCSSQSQGAQTTSKSWLQPLSYTCKEENISLSRSFEKLGTMFTSPGVTPGQLLDTGTQPF